MHSYTKQAPNDMKYVEEPIILVILRFLILHPDSLNY